MGNGSGTAAVWRVRAAGPPGHPAVLPRSGLRVL
jgi:hypothetical protein